MYLAFDTSTTACTAALLHADGKVLASIDEVIGRGHAERLAPMIADLLGGHVPSRILVGVGPGSFTGIRVAIAAAHGLALGWNVPLCGFDSLALLAAGAPGDGPVAVAVQGGHGELFVRRFARQPLTALSEARSLRPQEAAAVVPEALVVGSGASALVDARASGKVIEMLPSATHVLSLPVALRTLDPKPIYGRAPDARPEGGGMSSMAPRPTRDPSPAAAHLRDGGFDDLDSVMGVMDAAFPPLLGEAWTRSQCAGILPMAGVSLRLAESNGRVVGFALDRRVSDEAELLLIAVSPTEQGLGVGETLIKDFINRSQVAGARRLHLEVRDGNRAEQLYHRLGFDTVGRRRDYYRGLEGQKADALTLLLGIGV